MEDKANWSISIRTKDIESINEQEVNNSGSINPKTGKYRIKHRNEQYDETKEIVDTVYNIRGVVKEIKINNVNNTLSTISIIFDITDDCSKDKFNIRSNTTSLTIYYKGQSIAHINIDNKSTNNPDIITTSQKSRLYIHKLTSGRLESIYYISNYGDMESTIKRLIS